MNDKRNPDTPTEAETAPSEPKKTGGKRLAGSSPHEAQEYRGKRLLQSEEDTPAETAADASSSGESASPASESGKGRGRWFARLQDAALDLSDQVLDWRDDMTDRFSDMASDPENDSLPAKMIRQSEQIVSGIEDQERETDELTSEERVRRSERMQKAAGEHLNPDGSRPKFVFYTMENAPTRTRTGKPIELEHPTLIDRNGNVIPSDQQKAPDAESADTAQQDPAAEVPEPAPSVQPESPEESGSPNPAGPAPAAPAEEAEPAAREHAPRQRPRRTARPKDDAAGHPVPVPPTQTEHRQLSVLSRTVQYWLFFAVLGIAAVAGLIMPFRAETSALEGRTLTEQAEISFSGFADGSWFTEFDRWYNDTFPGRDRLAGLYDGLGAVFGFDNGSTVNAEDAETADGTDTSASDSSADTGDTSADEASEGTDASADEASDGTDVSADEASADTDDVSI